MHITDPIADMLTRIRNAGAARHATVEIPASSMKKAIAQILLDEGYIKAFEVIENGTQGTIKVTLKYSPTRKRPSPACAASLSPVCVSTPVLTSCPAS